jgi:photosystem II stability/assembly factor-like uncharacterized protein
MANNLGTIKFVTRDHGLVLYLGMGTWGFSPTDSGSVWSSTNGGISWTKVLEKGYTAFATTSEKFVFAGGLGGRFARSRDAGCTWIEDSLAVEGNIISLSASDCLNIVIATDAPAILCSADGGKTWRTITLPAPDFEVVDLITVPGKVWILQSPRENTIRTTAYYLWQERSEQAGAYESAESDWLSAEKSLSQRSLCYTDNYGRTWITTDQMPGHDRRTKLFGVGGSVNVAGSGCVIRAELDGTRISISQSPIPMTMFDISNDGTVIAGGYSMYGLLTVLNSIKDWRHDVRIVDNGIIDACLLDDTYGWAIAGSYGGNMPWRTEDGGATWSQLPKEIIYQGVKGITSPFADDSSTSSLLDR